MGNREDNTGETGEENKKQGREALYRNYLTIPSLDYEIALYTSKDTGMEAQDIIDLEDVGYLDVSGDNIVIADHAYQGFRCIKEAEPLKTNAEIKVDGITSRWMCVSKYENGTNSGNGIILPDGTNSFQCEDGELFMYTCNEDDSVTVGKKCNKEKICYLSVIEKKERIMDD